MAACPRTPSFYSFPSVKNLLIFQPHCLNLAPFRTNPFIIEEILSSLKTLKKRFDPALLELITVP